MSTPLHEAADRRKFTRPKARGGRVGWVYGAVDGDAHAPENLPARRRLGHEESARGPLHASDGRNRRTDLRFFPKDCVVLPQLPSKVALSTLVLPT